MENDDDFLGRLLTRREALALLGATGALLLAGCTGEEHPGSGEATPSGQAAQGATGVCVVRPEQTEGPYYVDEKLLRSDLRSDPTDGTIRLGAPLDLRFLVSRVTNGACVPLPNVLVDVWHCDALGAYSDVEDRNFDTRGKKFLRGYQVTDADGAAHFTTIYPGWYPGRTVHIHFKVRPAPSTTPGFDFTSQLYFDDAITDRVHARSPYAANGQRRQRNEGDGIFSDGGSDLMLPVIARDPGYSATFRLAIDLS